MYSAYKLNNQGDNIQPWCTHFPIWNQSVVLCPVLIVASWPEHRFLGKQFGWSGIPDHSFFVCVWDMIMAFFFSFIFISWRLITLQYCSGFCHTLTWISHGFTCIPHPDLPSYFPLYPIPLGFPSAAGPSTCLMHPTWAGDLFHPW